MKCIQCGTDNKLKDRVGNKGRCIRCNHPFVFEPQNRQPGNLTDKAFQNVLASISANGTLFYTSSQLLYLLDKRSKKSFASFLGGLVLYIFLSIWTTGFIGTILVIIFKYNCYPFVLAIYNLLYINHLFKLSNSSKLSFNGRKNGVNQLLFLSIFILLAGGYMSFISHSPFWYLAVISLSLLAFCLSLFQRKKLRNIPDELTIKVEKLQDYIDNWTRVNGPINKLLSSPNKILAKDTESTDALAEDVQDSILDQDVTAYSFDRAVICDRDEIAQMLIANNFHFENNCAILSVSGYPQRIFATTMQMLRRNPDLKVFAFHNCSPAGMLLVNHLRTSPEWFLDDNITIVDVGLNPRQILAAKKDTFFQRSEGSARYAQKLSDSIRQNLSTEELQWLDIGNFVELESFTPQKLIQILHRSINNSQQMLADETNHLILIEDNSRNIYTLDSFG